MRFFTLYLLISTILFTGTATAEYTYSSNDSRLISGVLYDTEGDPVTGTYEEYYDNNILKTSKPYVKGKLNGIVSEYNERGQKIADIPYVNGK